MTTTTQNNPETTLYKFLAQRKRTRNMTDLNQLHRVMIDQGYNVHYDDLINIFKGLQERGIGALVTGRLDKRSRFKWNYNLKEVARKALGEVPQEKPKVKRKYKRKIVRKPKNLELIIKIDTAKTSVKDIDALMTLAKSLESK